MLVTLATVVRCLRGHEVQYWICVEWHRDLSWGGGGGGGGRSFLFLWGGGGRSCIIMVKAGGGGGGVHRFGEKCPL